MWRPSKISSMTPAPVRNIHNHHQLQQKLQKCHPCLRGFLMPSNSTDFNQILNRASSEHMQTIQNFIKDFPPLFGLMVFPFRDFPWIGQEGLRNLTPNFKNLTFLLLLSLLTGKLVSDNFISDTTGMSFRTLLDA